MSASGGGVPATGPAQSITIWIYRTVVVYFLALRLWFDIAANPMGDEAYYWVWGQRLQLSYLDHPPLHAWLLGAVAAVLGWTPFAVRALTWLTLGGSLACLWVIAGRSAPSERAHRFWASAAIFLSLPVIIVATTPAFHDHLLVMLCLAAITCALVFADSHAAGKTRLGLFYAAAALCGLAILAKYNGVLLAAGLVAFLLVRRDLRGLWLTPHPYLAALLIAALQLPVLIWNLSADLATLSLHFGERPGGHWDDPRPVDTLRFLLTMVLPLGPFFLLGLILLPFAKFAAPFDRKHRALVLTLFVVSTLVLAVVALFTPVLLHWNIVAFVAAASMGWYVLRSPWLRWPHLALGIYLAAVFTWNYTVAPLRAPLFEDGETAKNYGWVELADAVREQQARHPDAFLATADYTYAARLAFQLKDPTVTAFGPIPSQYDLWWRPAEHLGQSALIVSDRSYTMAVAESQFARIERLARVPVHRGGELIWTFEIYLASDYVGPPPH